MHIRTYVSCFMLGVSMAAGIARANEVTLPYKGLTLNASFELAAGKQAADGVILITHGGLAHRDMEAIALLQALLKGRGHNTLAINLGLGLDNRHGMYDCQVAHRHRNTDAADEIGAWVGWLMAQGARRVTLLGHSRGGAQTALYAAEHDSDVLDAVVLLAPATRENTSAADYQRRYNTPLAPMLARAQQLIKDGNGDAVMQPANLLNCADTSATADAFVSYYGPQARVDTPELIPEIRKPTLVVVAGSDEVVVGLAEKVAPLADGKRVQMKIVAGSDHFFRDLYAEDAADAIDAFLRRGRSVSR